MEDKTIGNEYASITIEELENSFFVSKKFFTNNIDISESNFSFYKKDSGNHHTLEKLNDDPMLKLNAKFFVSNFKTMENLCRISKCIGFAPKKYIDTNEFKLIGVDFHVENTKINMCFPKNENISFACRKFIELIKYN